MCYMCRLNGFMEREDDQKALVNKTAYYNNLNEKFIPDGEEKVKEFYQCKRRCYNCGETGVTSHEKVQKLQKW